MSSSAASAARLTGFGASFAFVAALWLVNHWFAPERFALLSGAVNAVGMLGAAIGAVALSDLIALAGWRVDVLRHRRGRHGDLPGRAAVPARAGTRPPRTATTGPGEHIRQSLAGVLGHPRTWIIAIVSLLYYMPVNVYAGLWGTTELMKDHHLSRGHGGNSGVDDFLGHRGGQRCRRLAVGRSRPPQISGLRRRRC